MYEHIRFIMSMLRGMLYQYYYHYTISVVTAQRVRRVGGDRVVAVH